MDTHQALTRQRKEKGRLGLGSERSRCEEQSIKLASDGVFGSKFKASHPQLGVRMLVSSCRCRGSQAKQRTNTGQHTQAPLFQIILKADQKAS